MKYDKLVRDRIPEIMRDDGAEPTIHTASDDEYVHRLHEKLREETDEFFKDGDVGELADILEVVYALGDLEGVPRKQLEEMRAKKTKERGAFKERIVLDESQ